jgi:SAM-dependent methyltransferase
MCNPIPATLTANKDGADPVAAFAERMLDMLNGGALAIMTSIGHRTGLFDTMAELAPSTSAELALAAGLHERYVREWLAAMVTGGIVEYDPKRAAYTLPDHHAALLTRAATPDNLAVVAQFLPLLAQVEDDIVACFRHGGGIPYTKFPRFHEVMAEDSGQTVVAGLFEHLLPLIDGLHERLVAGIDVLDVGCGRGRALLALAAAFPASRFVGYDFSEEAIGWGQREAQRLDLENLVFEVRDAAQLDEVESYDLVTTFDAVHDQRAPDRVLAGIRRALRPDGVYLMQDIKGSSHVDGNMDHPLAPLLYTMSTMHCMTVSLADGGAGLGTLWGKEKALEMLGQAGFDQVSVHELPHDIQNYFYVAGPISAIAPW